MSNPFVAEIRMFPFNFAPKGWAFCNGQLLPLSQNTALFSLLGTFYGGDGKTTFALPNLQGNVAMHTDQYSGGGQYPLGAQGGEAAVTLLQTEIPVHNHTIGAASTVGDTNAPGTGVSLARSHNATAYQNNTTQNLVQMNFQTLSIAGGSLPHNNMMPYLTVSFCIAMQGVYPPRS
jgi:microcystin-dependent protein